MRSFYRLGLIGSRRRRQQEHAAKVGGQKTSLGEIAEVVSAMILALSAIAAVYQYWIARADRHVEQTFAFIERFDNDRLAAAQRSVDDLAGNAGQSIAAQLAAYEAAGMDRREVDAFADRLFVEAVLAQAGKKAAGDVPPALLEITSFFNGLQICIEEGLCDKSTAHAFLDTYAVSFWQTFEPVILHVRGKDRPRFADGMERFLKSIEKGRDG